MCLHCDYLFSSQLEKEDQIHSIDIGNEGSAFIEVLVGNSSSTRDQDYEVLLSIYHNSTPIELATPYLSIYLKIAKGNYGQ